MRVSSGMFRRGFIAGVYTGVVTARSSESPARDISYTVGIQGPNGPVKFEGVKPQEASRWTSFDQTIRVVPFAIDQRVTVHIEGREGSFTAIIETRELPDNGPCP